MFRFRLQRVLELREQREKAQAIMFAEAESAAEAAREEHQHIRSLYSEAMAKLATTRQADPTVGHLHHLGFVLNELDVRLGKAAEKVSIAEGVVAEARAMLDVAARDRRVMDRLKDKHEDVHRGEEAQRDRVLMDEIALGRYTRAHTTPTEGATEG